MSPILCQDPHSPHAVYNKNKGRGSTSLWNHGFCCLYGMHCCTACKESYIRNFTTKQSKVKTVYILLACLRKKNPHCSPQTFKPTELCASFSHSYPRLSPTKKSNKIYKLLYGNSPYRLWHHVLNSGEQDQKRGHQNWQKKTFSVHVWIQQKSKIK